jgi:hypothetical protein
MDATRGLFFAINMPSSGEDEPAAEVCIPNISPREREKRMRFAVAQFTVAIFILAALMVFNVDASWRLVLLFMFWPAAIGYFEERDKTCVAQAG